ADARIDLRLFFETSARRLRQRHDLRPNRRPKDFSTTYPIALRLAPFIYRLGIGCFRSLRQFCRRNGYSLDARIARSLARPITMGAAHSLDLSLRFASSYRSRDMEKKPAVARTRGRGDHLDN